MIAGTSLLSPMGMIWCLESGLALFLHILGIYLLLTAPLNVSSLLLAHLSIVEVVNIIYHWAVYIWTNWSGTYNEKEYSKALFGVYPLFMLYLVNSIILTVDRVLAVKLNLKYRLHVTKARLLAVCIASWIISGLFGWIMTLLTEFSWKWTVIVFGVVHIAAIVSATAIFS